MTRRPGTVDGPGSAGRSALLPTILLVDADEDARAMVRDALLEGAKPSVLRTVRGAEEMAEFLSRPGPLPSLLLIDLDLPDGDGAELIGELRTVNPHAMTLVLNASDDRRVHAQAVEAGAAGVLHKPTRIKEIIEAVRRLEAGEELLSANETGELLRLAGQQRTQDQEARLAVESLTGREREVLQALAEGLSDKEIAERLYVGVGTVRSHVVHILEKLGVHSRLQALVFAVPHGAVEIEKHPSPLSDFSRQTAGRYPVQTKR
jgi:DNA-binding NarL/FixJ family response regulator